MNIQLVFILIILTISNLALASEKTSIDVLINGELRGAEFEKSLANFAEAIKQAGMSKSKLYATYSQYIDKIGSKTIAEYLEKEDPACHGISHSLGKIIAERVNDLNTGMKICNSTCTYGCLHGVFKVYFSRLGKDYHKHDSDKMSHKMPHKKTHEKKVAFTQEELEKFSRDVNIACNQSNSVVDGFFKGNCAHGIGHAMAQLAGNAKLANIYCGVFPQADMQYYCETGVFMELSSTIKKQVFKSSLKRSEKVAKALRYCEKDSQYPSACLRFLLPSNKTLGHITRYASQCVKETNQLRQHCFNALGYHSRTYVAKNPQEINYACLFGDEQDKMACISGISLMKKGQRYQANIQEACKQLEDESLKTICNRQVVKYYYDLNNEYFLKLVKR